MARPRLPPRLYFHTQRSRWVIRNGQRFISLPFKLDEEDKAKNALFQYIGTEDRKNDRIRNRIDKRNKLGTVYVIGMGHFVKIGFTETNLENRLRCMKVSMPEDPVLYAEIRGSRADELSLHRRFIAHRAKREWFVLEGELEEWVSEGCPYRSISSRDTEAEACSSAVERGPYTADAAGSNPATPSA